MYRNEQKLSYDTHRMPARLPIFFVCIVVSRLSLLSLVAVLISSFESACQAEEAHMAYFPCTQ